MHPNLPMPELRESEAAGISFLADEALFRACGVRIAFTGRAGGVSTGPYASLNLGGHVGDDPLAVERNRQLLLDALDGGDAEPIMLNQVHGDQVVSVHDASTYELDRVRALAQAGADAIVVETAGIAPILCFADCVPVIIVAASGAFAVAHAGWRGVMAGVAARAAKTLAASEVRAGAAATEAAALSGMNVYLGPHIGACCFHTGSDVRERFKDRFGNDVLTGADCVDLAAALQVDLSRAGIDPDRICVAGICTACNSQDYFSYRASGGTCGRHAAVAFRKRGRIMSIAEHYEQVRSQVTEECRIAGRSPQEVTLVAVSKTVDRAGVAAAFDAGARDFGENRPDQLAEKAEAFPQARWHFIGNIQSRQIRKIVEHAHLIHSLYEDRHAAKISQIAVELGKVQDVLLEVNVSGEESKSGVEPDLLPALAEFTAGLPNVRLRGLMTMAPQGDLDEARRTFAGLRRLADELRSGMDDSRAAAFDQLSMGMSEDWRCAIEEGATIVRIGRAIFSDDFA